MSRTRAAALCLLALLTATQCLAWGTKGHAWIAQNAVTLLPPTPLSVVLSQHQSSVIQSAITPDFQWKDGSIARLEAPDHYIDLEVLSSTPTRDAIPRTRLEAARGYTDLGILYSDGGFLPWRVEETYWALVNAIKTDPQSAPFWAGILSHYVADCTQPLHTTVHYDGRVDRKTDGVPELKGIHADYEITYLEDEGIEFRRSSLALARPTQPMPDVFAAAVDAILASHALVDGLYDVARRRGEGRFEAWDREMGQMTRGQLAGGAALLASLWQAAWEQAGKPDLKPQGGRQ